MILSMTGYGNASGEAGNFSVSVEIKTLNSRYLDVIPRIPKDLAEKETELRSYLSDSLQRGKINISIELKEKEESQPKVSVNKALITAYYKDLKDAADSLGVDNADLFRIATTMPDAIEAEEGLDNLEDIWKEVLAKIKEAVDKVNKFRQDEGASLQNKLQEYISVIADCLDKVADYDPKRIERIRERIEQAFEKHEMADQVDKNRFEQELIYYIEKLDIHEEKVRLKSHLDYFTEAMQGEGSGKKLNFIAQEIGREINTIGSKCNDADIQKLVVQMKEELEKIKEQVMNIV